DGTALQLLTSTAGWNITAGIWSPDGRRLTSSSDFGTRPFFLDLATLKQEPMNESIRSFVPTSWSRDGRRIAGFRTRSDSVDAGLVVYDVATRRAEEVTQFGAWPRWLSDGQGLMFNNNGKLTLLDTRTGKLRDLLSPAPLEVESSISLSPDDQWIYVSLSNTEADVWMMTWR